MCSDLELAPSDPIKCEIHPSRWANPPDHLPTGTAASCAPVENMHSHARTHELTHIHTDTDTHTHTYKQATPRISIITSKPL